MAQINKSGFLFGLGHMDTLDGNEAVRQIATACNMAMVGGGSISIRVSESPGGLKMSVDYHDALTEKFHIGELRSGSM